MIKLLLEYGADINAIGNGVTAIDIARENNHFEAIKFLESKGAKTYDELVKYYISSSFQCGH